MLFFPAILLINIQVIPLLYKTKLPDNELTRRYKHHDKLTNLSFLCLLGSSNGMITMAEYYRREKLLAAERSWLLFAAEQKSPLAMYLLSKHYAAVGNKKEALHWIKEALTHDKRLQSKDFRIKLEQKINNQVQELYEK